MRVAVIGGGGFVGTALTAELLGRGVDVRIVSRRAGAGAAGAEWRVCASARQLPQAVAGCDGVVNLAGILNKRHFHAGDFRRVHVRLVEDIVAACRGTGVARLLHVSALNASRNAPSEYLRTKGEGEDCAHAAAGIRTTSFRPSVIFGRGDSFLNRFAALLKWAPGVFPLACADTMFAPVFVGDVARAMADSLEDDGAGGARLPLCGPRDWSLREIVEYTAHLNGRRINVVGLPDPLSRMQARVLECLPGKPFSMDNYLSLQVDSVCDDARRCAVALEEVAPDYIGAAAR